MMRNQPDPLYVHLNENLTDCPGSAWRVQTKWAGVARECHLELDDDMQQSPACAGCRCSS